jgi:hypothetical protein
MSGFQPDSSIPVTFARPQWEQIMSLLARLPFNEVAGIISDVQRQCQMAEMSQRMRPSMSPAGQGPMGQMPQNMARQQMPRLVPEDYGPLPPAPAQDGAA